MCSCELLCAQATVKESCQQLSGCGKLYRGVLDVRPCWGTSISLGPTGPTRPLTSSQIQVTNCTATASISLQIQSKPQRPDAVFLLQAHGTGYLGSFSLINQWGQASALQACQFALQRKQSELALLPNPCLNGELMNYRTENR